MNEANKYRVGVTANSTYLPDQWDEEEDRYVFAYTIRITNNGSVSAQLVSRHWIITDADNQVQEVRGMGVVGEQPVLKPGDTFEYSSGSSIPTAVGTMRGSYQLVADAGPRAPARRPPAPPPIEYRGTIVPASWLDLPRWGREPLRPSLEAFARSCAVLEKQDPWKAVCAGAQTLLPGTGEREIASFFEMNFDPYRVINADESDTGMVTGYYEPLLHGSRIKSKRFRY